MSDLNYTSYSPPWINPCLSESNLNKSFCNTSLSYSERAYDLVYNEISSLPINTQYDIFVGLSGNNADPVDQFDIPGYQWWNEALHGIVCNQFTGSTCNGPYINYTTLFPMPIGISSSFNSKLFYDVANAVGVEGRAMFNVNQSALTFWAPNINIYRDPRWGRGQETPGEDPFLSGVFAENWVRGMQGNDSNYLLTSSACKHFADYSLEDSDGYTRYTFNAIISDYDQNDTYLVAFKYCFNAKVSGLMCSYNSVNGIPACADRYLLTDVARNQFNFYGYITSDDTAVEQIQIGHNYTNTTDQTMSVIYQSGMDVCCGDYTQKYLKSAILNASVKLDDVKRSTYNLFLVQFRLGMFDNLTNNKISKYNQNDVCSKYNLELSLNTTQQSIVLLKNNNNYLPLSKAKNINDSNNIVIALIGPNANNSKSIIGADSAIPPFVINVYDGVKQYNTYYDTILYSIGCDINNSNTDSFNSSINITSLSNITILVMGLDKGCEGEHNDRYNLLLPGVQNDLIRNITTIKSNVILIILSGGCVDISEWENNPNISSIIWAGYPGMYAGTAIANVLYGDYNPSGRLTQTWYYNNYTLEIEMDNMNMRPNTSKTINNPGRGYRYFSGNVLYPFGYGISYTDFICSDLDILFNNIITTNVTNIGPIKGSAIVLIYFIPNNAGNNGIPIKRLIAFGRVNDLNVNKTTKLTMNMYQEFVGSNEQKNGGQYIKAGVCE